MALAVNWSLKAGSYSPEGWLMDGYPPRRVKAWISVNRLISSQRWRLTA